MNGRKIVLENAGDGCGILLADDPVYAHAAQPLVSLAASIRQLISISEELLELTTYSMLVALQLHGHCQQGGVSTNLRVRKNDRKSPI